MVCAAILTIEPTAPMLFRPVVVTAGDERVVVVLFGAAFCTAFAAAEAARCFEA